MKRSDLIEIIRQQRDAAQAVIDNWEKGDLAGAVNNLREPLKEADEAITWWESDE